MAKDDDDDDDSFAIKSLDTCPIHVEPACQCTESWAAWIAGHLRPPELLVSVSSDGNVLQWSLKKGRRRAEQLGTVLQVLSSNLG